jgi:O-antigen/teichoic acid export membrane protein
LGEPKKAANLLNLSTRLLSFVTMLGALVALLFGNTIIRLLFSETYVPSAPIFVLLMVGLNFAFVDYTLGYTLVAAGQSDKPAYINVVHTTISLLGNIMLIPWLGAKGAALANLAGFGAANPLNVLFLRRREIDVKIANYLKPISIFGVCWLLVALLHPSTLLAQAAIVIFFCIACMLLSVITLEELVTAWGEVNTALAQFLGKQRTEANKALGSKVI